MLEFWPFTSSTSPFAPFFESPDALSVPRPLSLDEPYLPADEYPTTRWVREEEGEAVMVMCVWVREEEGEVVIYGVCFDSVRERRAFRRWSWWCILQW